MVTWSLGDLWLRPGAVPDNPLFRTLKVFFFMTDRLTLCLNTGEKTRGRAVGGAVIISVFDTGFKRQFIGV
jgi:hypothetical protein